MRPSRAQCGPSPRRVYSARNLSQFRRRFIFHRRLSEGGRTPGCGFLIEGGRNQVPAACRPNSGRPAPTFARLVAVATSGREGPFTFKLLLLLTAPSHSCARGMSLA